MVFCFFAFLLFCSYSIFFLVIGFFIYSTGPTRSLRPLNFKFVNLLKSPTTVGSLVYTVFLRTIPVPLFLSVPRIQGQTESLFHEIHKLIKMMQILLYFTDQKVYHSYIKVQNNLRRVISIYKQGQSRPTFF